MLKLVLRICEDLAGFDLRLKDIDMKFTRRNYEAIQSKSQVLVSMLQQPKIHPRLAFLHSGLFTDAESAYAMSKEYYEQIQREKGIERTSFSPYREIPNGTDIIEHGGKSANSGHGDPL